MDTLSILYCTVYQESHGESPQNLRRFPGSIQRKPLFYRDDGAVKLHLSVLVGTLQILHQEVRMFE